METSGNQVVETVQEIGMLTLSEQGVETGDAGKTQLTGVETRIQQDRDRSEEKHELTSGASGREDNQLQGVETGDLGDTLGTGVETGDAGETRKGHNRSEEEDEQISGAAGSENNQLQEDSIRLVKLAAYSEATASPEKLLEQWPNDIKAMLLLVDGHILFHQADSALDVARKFKEYLVQKPKPPKVHDLMSEAEKCKGAEKYSGQLIFLWCACWLADGNKKDEVCAMAECLEGMNAVVIDTVHEVVRDAMGNLLCLLSEDLIETLDDFGDDWFIKIRIRCFGNKAFGLLQQQLKFSEAIQVYKSCISKICQRLGPNANNCVVLGEFLAMLGQSLLSLDKDSPEGFKNMKDARIIMLRSSPTSAFEERIRATVLETSKSKCGFKKFLRRMFCKC